MTKIISLDGLRGIAVLLVLIDHFPLIEGAEIINTILIVIKLVDPGYLGVEIFFVLSGFLITKVLVADYTRNKQGVIYRFYMKRILRIFPVLYLTILICLMVLPNYNYLFPSFFLTNYYLVFENISHPLRHFWSLAVEEQYYLFWPLILIWTALDKQKLRYVFLLIIIISSCMILYQTLIQNTEFAISLVRKGLESKMLTLSLGGILAIYGVPKIKIIPLSITLFISLSIIAGAMFLSKIYPWFPLHTIKAFGFAITSFLVFILAHNNYKIWQYFFCFRFLRFTGEISYGLYVYHAPVLFYFNIHRDKPISADMALFLIICILSISLASWYFMEKPLLRFKSKYFSVK